MPEGYHRPPSSFCNCGWKSLLLIHSREKKSWSLKNLILVNFQGVLLAFNLGILLSCVLVLLLSDVSSLLSTQWCVECVEHRVMCWFILNTHWCVEFVEHIVICWVLLNTQWCVEFFWTQSDVLSAAEPAAGSTLFTKRLRDNISFPYFVKGIKGFKYLHA